MTEVDPVKQPATPPNPLPLMGRPHELIARVRFIAQETSHVIISSHAQGRMEKRGIYMDDVYRVLRLGELKGPPEEGINPGEVVCKVVATLRGSRQIGVVTAVLTDDKLFVVTVEWEDK